MEKRPVTAEENRQLMLGAMDAIHSYCEANGLRYYLAYGTLLGAVRHKGFIPWDDDVDIVMPRRDYEKFIREFRTEPYQVMHPALTPGYYYPFAKVVDSRTELWEEKLDAPIPLGTYIDIFPLDGCGDDRQAAFDLITKKTYPWWRLWVMKLRDRKKKRAWYQQGAMYVIKGLLKPVSNKRIALARDRIAQLCGDMDTSRYCASTVEMVRPEEIVETEVYRDSVLLSFEGRKYRAPARYEELLRGSYGDYMTPPPPDQRVPAHHFTVTWKNPTDQ